MPPHSKTPSPRAIPFCSAVAEPPLFRPGRRSSSQVFFLWGMGTFLPEDADSKQRLDILQIIELFGRTQGLIRSLPGRGHLCKRNLFEEFVGLPVLGEVTHFVVREV